MEQENLRKRIIYRSYYRGCRENDQLVGEFVKNHLINEVNDSYNLEELGIFERFLEESDNDIFSWLSEETLPLLYRTRLIENLLKFIKRKNVIR